MFNLQTIENSTGHLVLNEDGAVLSSHGELQNDEMTASSIYSLISIVKTVDPEIFSYKGCQKVSICFDEFSYTICQSNKKILIIKRGSNESANKASNILE